MRGQRPRYPLARIKTAFADAARLNRTMSAAEGAENLGMVEQAVVEVIQGLTARDFEKSTPSDLIPGSWHDLYKPVFDGREFYIEFTRDSQRGLLLIAFRENTLL
jgi:motility quorum-sensing regulator / GCU-specific mRNA interferase toxin